MEKGTTSILGWGHIVLGVILALNQSLGWPGGLQYLWALLVVVGGIWLLSG